MGIRMKARIALIAGAAMALVGTANAADIERVSANDGSTVIILSGDINVGDDDRFKLMVSGIPPTAVYLSSIGGMFVPGLQIAAMVHDRGDFTVVPAGEKCASVCGVIWLSGSSRFLSPSSKVGFHGVYNVRTGQQDGSANAVLGAYLSKIGLSIYAIDYATRADSLSMEWLSTADADRLGIKYTMLNMPDPGHEEEFGRGTPVVPPSLLTSAVVEPWLTSAVASLSSPQFSPNTVARLFDSKVPVISYLGKDASIGDIVTSFQVLAANHPNHSFALVPGSVVVDGVNAATVRVIALVNSQEGSIITVLKLTCLLGVDAQAAGIIDFHIRSVFSEKLSETRAPKPSSSANECTYSTPPYSGPCGRSSLTSNLVRLSTNLWAKHPVSGLASKGNCELPKVSTQASGFGLRAMGSLSCH